MKLAVRIVLLLLGPPFLAGAVYLLLGSLDVDLEIAFPVACFVCLVMYVGGIALLARLWESQE